MKRDLRWTRLRLIGIALAFVAAGAGVSVAAGPCFPGFPCPSPTPTPTAAPTPTPPASSSPSPSPTPTPIVPGPTEPGVTPRPSASAKASTSPDGKNVEKESSTLPPGLTQPSFNIPLLARSAPRNTFDLIEALRPLTKFGFSLQQVLLQGMGRFPVAGVAFWHDDWLEARNGPPPHLHHGLDIFADFGTPIRSPVDGAISSMGDEASDRLGGTNVYVRGNDGVEYYFAHLMARAEGLYIGKSVKVGTVIAFVGDTGNARGGAPHLHFEIHNPGPVPPKPIVDKWLDDAEAYAPSWVKLETDAVRSRKHSLQGPSGDAPGRSADLDTTMLLTLLDPVAGSVGLLPRLELQPPATPVSTVLWTQLVSMRLDGHLLTPGKQSALQPD